jgi:hypothetical protein
MFQLHTRYTYTMPQGTISDEGIRLIQNFLNEQHMDNGDWKALNPNPQRFYLPILPQG